MNQVRGVASILNFGSRRNTACLAGRDQAPSVLQAAFLLR